LEKKNDGVMDDKSGENDKQCAVSSIIKKFKEFKTTVFQVA